LKLLENTVVPFGAISLEGVAPVLVFIAMVMGIYAVMSLISSRNSQAETRLERMGRSKSLAEIEANDSDKFGGLKNAFKTIGTRMDGQQSELERNTLKVNLANAGFRSDTAAAVYQGMRIVFLLGGVFLAVVYLFLSSGINVMTLCTGAIIALLSFYIPVLGLKFLKSQRQYEIFLTLPDALDLLVVCVESGLGLDAGMRRVTDEMKGHAKVLTEEFALANLQLQMGRPRREVLHDLGVRTGVDDVRSLAAILIQADRFGASIAQALRVQSDTMRTKRRQLAEEKAAKVAVKLIFPLVLFIFPAIFVVLVGPAALQIYRNLLSKTPGG
jgi:tight adherence protein C